MVGQARYSQRSGQVGLAGTRPTDQDNVLRVLREAQIRQLLDERFVDLRYVEVKACKVPMDRERCSFHLVSDGAHVPVHILGLEQVFDQPA